MATAVQDNVTGERLAAARRAVGLSQRDLAARLGMPMWGVEQMERGRADPGPYLSEISSLTGQPLAYFLAPRPRQAAEDEVDLTEAGEEDTEALVPRRYLVLAALTLLMTIRFFTESIRVLPKIVSFIDIPVFFVILIFAVQVRTWRPDPAPLRAIGVLAAMFLGIVMVAVMTNLGRVEAAPAVVFIYMFLGPVAWAVAVYRLWPAGNAPTVTRWIFGLSMVQLAVVLLFNLPKFIGDRNPDYFTGTFGENGYQLVLFLLVSIAAMAGLLTYDSKRPIARFAIPSIVAFAVVIFLVQYRALLVTLALTILLLGFFMRGRAKGILVGGAVAFVLVGALFAISANFSELKYQQVSDIAEEGGPMVFLNARLRVAGDVVNLYSDNPRYVLTGTGPGTFSSRAWRTFGVADNPTKTTAGSLVNEFTGGQAYRTDVSDKYTLPRLRAQEVIGGSVQLTQPFSSYTASAAEVGIGGLLLILSIYVVAFLWAARMTHQAIADGLRSDPIVPVTLAAAVAFFVLLQLGVLESWLEVTRITFFAWALLAIAAKELGARHQD